MRWLRLFEVFNRSGKCLLWNASSQTNTCRAFIWSGKCPSGMCLVGKCPPGMCLVCQVNVRRGSVHRGNVRQWCVRELLQLSYSSMFFAETLHTFSSYQCLQKNRWVFFILFRSCVIWKIRKDIVFTHSFLILLLITQDLNKI